MKTVAELCKPRASVFADGAREDVKDLTNLVRGEIDGVEFFKENFLTEGMKTLIDVAMHRFRGETDTGVVKLTQAMGGGKTHNMIALALLAQNPELRKKVLGDGYDDIGEVKVIAFTGRESDAPFGIWGSLAEQLGKKELFKDYYAPLQAPGQTAWTNLLGGEKVLILLDELPPYLVASRATTIGNSDLSVVTTTALSNLFNAIGQEALKNVCLVFSDLKATYEEGSQLLQQSFKALENEANRLAINIEPVSMNSDEIYDILRTRLFEKLPKHGSEEIYEVALAYKAALEKAEQSGYTNQSSAARFTGIKDSYPFHPSIKELYARFRTNPNFQQTRGLIKLMRQIIRVFYESGNAEHSYLVNVFDIDLNNQSVLSHINTINNSLANAISHDIAMGGKSIAESIDAKHAAEASRGETKVPYAQNLAKLLFMSSLSELALSVKGLNASDMYGFLCEPHTDIGEYKRVFDELVTQCWYMKSDSQGRYYFHAQKNLIAQMNTLMDGYNLDLAKAELSKRLTKMFSPTLNTCYGKLYVMPALDQIALERDKVSLIIFEPYQGGGINPELYDFYQNQPYKNRAMFLSGPSNMMDKLIENSKKLMAIEHIIKDMQNEHVSESDQQYKEALDSKYRTWIALYNNVVHMFVTLWWPNKNGLDVGEINFKFVEKDGAVTMDSESQIIAILQDNQKFEPRSDEDAKLDILRKKCEKHLFTQKEMPWRQILERAATEPSWQWFEPSQMESLKNNCLKKDLWREQGGYLVKGPFEKEPTSVSVSVESYDAKTNEFTLNVRGMNGSSIYYEVGAEPTTASAKVTGSRLTTKEIALNFICVDEDENGEKHPTGEVNHYICKAPIRFDQRAVANGVEVVLETHPKYELRYTTDGSEPRENGGVYDGPITVGKECSFVLAVALYNDTVIDKKSIAIRHEGKGETVVQKIDKDKPLAYNFRFPRSCNDTAEVYAELDKMSSVSGVVMKGLGMTIQEKANGQNFIEIVTGGDGNAVYAPDDFRAIIDILRDTTGFKGRDISVGMSYQSIICDKGETFLKWMNVMGRDLNKAKEDGEIVQ